jgi:group I intron endonuclease
MSIATQDVGISLEQSGIYCIENLINGKVYIGSSKHLRKRRNDHYCALSRNMHRNEHLQKSWNKYGEESFIFYVVEAAPLHLLEVKEQEYISHWKACDRFFGYNKSPTAGSIRGVTFSEEIRKKFSRNRKAFFQTEKGQEERNKLSIALKKRMNDPKTKEAIRKKMSIGITIANANPLLRELHRQNTSKRHKDQEFREKWLKANGCKLFACEQTGKTYMTTLSAAEDLGISQAGLYANLVGKTRQIKGYTFKYCEEGELIVLKPLAGKTKKSPSSKPVRCIETGEVFFNVKEASEKLGVQTCAIYCVLRGEWKHTHGLTFEYPDLSVSKQENPLPEEIPTKPKRKANKHITAEELNQKLPEHLKIKPETFTNMKTPAIFIDSLYGEFEALPIKVVHRGKMHPQRCKDTASDRARHAAVSGRKKARQTCRERYGVSSPLQSRKIKEKVKETMMERYGVPYAMMSETVKAKAVETNREKFGSDWAVGNKEFRNRCLDALEERTGSRIPSGTPEAIEKTKKTCLKRYGVDNVSKSTKVIEKILSKQTQYVSAPEREITDWIESLGLEVKKHWVGRYSLDIFIPLLNIAIEYNGLYWHSEQRLEVRLQGNAKKYHLNKTEACEEAGIALVHVWGHWWECRKEQVKNFLLSKLGMNSVGVGARGCVFKEIEGWEGAEFLEEAHILGSSGRACLTLGCYYEEELVGVCTFSKHHRGRDEFVLDRFACKTGWTIHGALSKFTKMALVMLKTDRLISWADRCISNANGYLRAGWVLEEVLMPDYFYYSPRKKTDGGYISKFSRSKKTVGTPEGMTEREHALQDGLFTVWDCGKYRLSYSL